MQYALNNENQTCLEWNGKTKWDHQSKTTEQKIEEHNEAFQRKNQMLIIATSRRNLPQEPNIRPNIKAHFF
jgi:hypothetical protein